MRVRGKTNVSRSECVIILYNKYTLPILVVTHQSMFMLKYAILFVQGKISHVLSMRDTYETYNLR